MKIFLKFLWKKNWKRFAEVFECIKNKNKRVCQIFVVFVHFRSLSWMSWAIFCLGFLGRFFALDFLGDFALDFVLDLVFVILRCFVFILACKLWLNLHVIYVDFRIFVWKFFVLSFLSIAYFHGILNYALIGIIRDYLSENYRILPNFSKVR